jgi:hypothetical protein
VIERLGALDVEACPVAQVGDRLLFLVAEGSMPELLSDLDGLPPGLVTHRAVDDLPGLADGDGDGCWVIPVPSNGSGLPLASAVVEAVRSAYAVYGAVRAGGA